MIKAFYSKLHNNQKCLVWLAALLIPLLYLVLYTPYGMDTTDFGYFYGYGWRILNGQIPYRDFYYIKPAFPLYWHAFWMWLTPENFQVLAGKAGFILSMLASSWFGSLYLARMFNLGKLSLALPLLATGAFVFGVHSFPHMPWHTPDGVLFSSASLWLASLGWPFAAGVLSACALLCKQSFLFVPIGIACMIWFCRPRKAECLYFGLAVCLSLSLAWFWLYSQGAWKNFRLMTTGQLDVREALDAGIMIYLRQNWLLPALASLPWIYSKILHRKLWLYPCYCYLASLLIWYVWQVYAQKAWIGFGASWPTLFILLGGVCVLLPKFFLLPYVREENLPFPRVAISSALCAALLVAWSVAVSGGYKIPAFFAAPLLFSFFLIHAHMGGNVNKLAWSTLFCGLLMFGIGYQYPYVFPVRPLSHTELIHDAGQIYPKASGVKVDADMLERLRELKMLREKYGPGYKTLPGFSFSYYLNNDYPLYRSDWLIDWEINGDIEKLYQELLDKKLTVFMERDQLDTAKADNYDRAGYGVPQLVRKNWKIVEETPHFVVFQAPGG